MNLSRKSKKNVIKLLLTCLFVTVFYFNVRTNVGSDSKTDIVLQSLGIQEALGEDQCNGACNYAVQACPDGGSKCGGSGSQCGSPSQCRG